jgi:hypothetical protein
MTIYIRTAQESTTVKKFDNIYALDKLDNGSVILRSLLGTCIDLTEVVPFVISLESN